MDRLHATVVPVERSGRLLFRLAIPGVDDGVGLESPRVAREFVFFLSFLFFLFVRLFFGGGGVLPVRFFRSFFFLLRIPFLLIVDHMARYGVLGSAALFESFPIFVLSCLFFLTALLRGS